MGAKMEGIMESLAQKAHSSLQGKNVPKKEFSGESFLLSRDPTLITGTLL